MKLTLNFLLAKNSIKQDLRRALLSFFKFTLSAHNPDLYEQLYGPGKTVQKPFAFSIGLDKPVFTKEGITLNSPFMEVNLITNAYSLGIDLYNNFLQAKEKKFKLTDNNTMTLKQVRITNQPHIVQNSILVKMRSPLVVRQHEKNVTDKYFQYCDEDFTPKLKICLQQELTHCTELNVSMDDFKIEVIKGKKVFVKAFNLVIPASLGIYRLSGPAEVLDALYQSGLGSRRSEGFGVFELLS